MGMFKKKLVSVRFTKDFTSPVYGNVYRGKVVKDMTEEMAVKFVKAELAEEYDGAEASPAELAAKEVEAAEDDAADVAAEDAEDETLSEGNARGRRGNNRRS